MKTPTSLKINSIIYYIISGLLALLGVLMIIGIIFLGTAMTTSKSSLAIAFGQIINTFVFGIILVAFLFFFIIYAGIAVLLFFMAGGLWKMKRWAVIASGFCSLILFFLGIGTLVSGLNSGIIFPAIIVSPIIIVVSLITLIQFLNKNIRKMIR